MGRRVLVSVFGDASADLGFAAAGLVEYDAPSEGQEFSGDGVLSFTHTPVGSSNLGVFIGVTNVSGTARTLTSTSYGGVGGSELFDLAVATIFGSAGASVVGVSGGAQTVSATLSGGPDNHYMAVITMTGVHQSTPTRTTVTASGTGGTPTVNATTAVANDLVVGCYYENNNTADATAGTNETERVKVGGPAGDAPLTYIFTQAGSNGGVIQPNVSSPEDWIIAAIPFRPA
jgi:hypothetical protein